MTTKIRPSTLENTAVSAGTYGGASVIPVVTIDAQGRATYAANATPSIATSLLTGTVSATQIANSQTYGINVSGNAGTVTNGVYTSGSYSDPSWLTISKSKVGLGNVDNTADANKSVSYASSAGAVAWTNVTSRPTAVSAFTNDSGYQTSSGSVNYATSAGAVAWSNVSSKPSINTLVGSYDTGYLGDGANGAKVYDIPMTGTTGYYGVPVIKIAIPYWTSYGGYGSYPVNWYMQYAMMLNDGTNNYLRIRMVIDGGGLRWPNNFVFYFYG